MNTEFTKQWAICNRWERKCNLWFNIWWFLFGASVMSLLTDYTVLSIVMYALWCVATIIMGWHVERYCREVDKL